MAWRTGTTYIVHVERTSFYLFLPLLSLDAHFSSLALYIHYLKVGLLQSTAVTVSIATVQDSQAVTKTFWWIDEVLPIASCPENIWTRSLNVLRMVFDVNLRLFNSKLLLLYFSYLNMEANILSVSRNLFDKDCFKEAIFVPLRIIYIK